MDKYLRNIDRQIGSNQGRNIFLDEAGALRFVEDTFKAASGLDKLSGENIDLLIEYCTDKALEEFCRINQYYSFNSRARNELRDIYRTLFSDMRDGQCTLETLEKKHYRKLKEWLQKTNPFAGLMYAEGHADLNPVACSEYQAGLQIAVLRIDIATVHEPVLDIGCGKQGNLVRYLRGQGIQATGIDRFAFSDKDMVSSDWLEYDYGVGKWGTIVSNLAFSNHFKHHNLREDGSCLEYAGKYMEILGSLKTGGSFHYAPDLPFIEKYLDREIYAVDNHYIGNLDFQSTIITRLK